MAEGRQCETSGLFRIDRVARSRALGLIRLASAIQNCSIRKVFTSATPRDKHHRGRFFFPFFFHSPFPRGRPFRVNAVRDARGTVCAASPKKFGSLDQYRASYAGNAKDTSAKNVSLEFLTISGSLKFTSLPRVSHVFLTNIFAPESAPLKQDKKKISAPDVSLGVRRQKLLSRSSNYVRKAYRGRQAIVYLAGK